MQPEPGTLEQLRILSHAVLGRRLSDTEIVPLLPGDDPGDVDLAAVLALLSSSGEGVGNSLEHAAALHLNSMHRARACAVATLLPPASRIVDLGGANAPLCDMAYPHAFSELTVVDLPPADRHEAFAGRVVESRLTPLGPVRVLYSDMADLIGIDDESVDLVWSGQSIEHVTLDHARAVFREVIRVLRPDGWFCLDTPNRLLTGLHTGAGFIHPDHKIEYTPAELIAELNSAGFAVIDSFGICDMPLTATANEFDYRDFVVGSAISRSVDTSYVQFHRCRRSDVMQVVGSSDYSHNVPLPQKPLPQKIAGKARATLRRGRAALVASPPTEAARLDALEGLIREAREEQERQFADLKALMVQFHTDAWEVAHVRNFDLDTLVRRLHTDSDTTLRRLLDHLEQDSIAGLQREIAIDYESTIEALTYVARSLRDVYAHLAPASQQALQVSGSGDHVAST